MLTDTHAHLYLRDFDEDRTAMFERAFTAGVTKFYLPNIDASSIDSLLNLEQQMPDQCFAMMGLHPCSVREDFEKELNIVQDWLHRRPFCAIGEIGIDLYWDTSFLEQQKIALITQIRWAKQFKLPVVIHSRNALDLIIQLLKPEKDEHLGGIFHCFSGTEKQAREIMDLGFYLGIGGVLTFKKSGLDEVVKTLPLERIVLETDAPYLAPVPYRGKRNESAYLKLVAEKLSDIKNVDYETVANITTENAKKIFKN